MIRHLVHCDSFRGLQFQQVYYPLGHLVLSLKSLKEETGMFVWAQESKWDYYIVADLRWQFIALYRSHKEEEGSTLSWAEQLDEVVHSLPSCLLLAQDPSPWPALILYHKLFWKVCTYLLLSRCLPLPNRHGKQLTIC